MDDTKNYSDFKNVEIQRTTRVPEQTPEGPYGSPIGKYKPVSPQPERKRRDYSAFNYENKELHENLPRQGAIAHPTHDEKEE